MAAVAASSGPRYAPEDPTLPRPWRGLVDGKTGYLYFWNPETNVTQYERPIGSGPPQKSSSVLVSSSVHIQQSSQGQRSGNPNEDRDNYERSSNDVSKPDAASRNQQTRGGPAPSQNAARAGTFSSSSAANVAFSAGHGGAARGQGTSDGGSGLSAESYRRRHEITVSGDNVPPPFTSFEAAGFPPEMLREGFPKHPSLWRGLLLVMIQSATQSK